MTRQHAGFTLLEVLVALAVFGGLLLGLVQGVQYGVLAWRAQTRMEELGGDLAAVDRALRHLIEHMDPGDPLGPSPLAASHAALGFITELPGIGDDTLPRQRVDVVLLVDGRHRLILRWRPHRHAVVLRAPSPMTETELLPGVSRLEISYLQPTGAWASTMRYPGLPLLVRLHLVFAEGNARSWPDIVAEPHLDPR